MPEGTAALLAGQRSLIAELTGAAGEQAGHWDLAGELPADMLRKLGAQGLLCAEVPAAHGGLGTSSADNGEFTAYVGSLCSSLRSIMTSQGMAAWTIQRLGTTAQRADHLAALTSGQLAAVAFSEPDAGSDLSAIQTRISPDPADPGGQVVIDGQKKWITGARYADLLLVLGRFGDGAAFAVVPADAAGVHIEPVANPLGCRAAGHSDVQLRGVRLPASCVLGGGGQPLPMLITTALSYGRMSVAWGCTGIVRACLDAATQHARVREQSGQPLAGHQLVARHLAELYAAEQVCTRICAHASACWDTRSPDLVMAVLTAKYVSSGHAARCAASAVEVLASAGAQDGHVVARAYRDAKLMELIEGTSEICQLLLAQQAVASSGTSH